MKGKKSIVIYLDQAQVFKTLPDELAAALIRHIVKYCNEEGEETPDPEDPVLNALFLPFKLFLKRDLKKWEVRQIQNKINGAKGGRPRKDGAKNPTKPKITQPVINETQKKALMVNSKLLIDNSNSNISSTLKSRRAEFKNSLRPFLEKYSKELLEEFFGYWSEHNEKGRLMRYEMKKNQPFNISRRLVTWAKKDQEFKKEKNFAQKEKPKMLTEVMKDRAGITGKIIE